MMGQVFLNKTLTVLDLEIKNESNFSADYKICVVEL